MKVHIWARDASDAEALRFTANELAATVGGRGSDFLLFSAFDDTCVHVVELSPWVARRLSAEGTSLTRRRALAARVIAAVLDAFPSGVPDGEVVH